MLLLLGQVIGSMLLYMHGCWITVVCQKEEEFYILHKLQNLAAILIDFSISSVSKEKQIYVVYLFERYSNIFKSRENSNFNAKSQVHCYNQLDYDWKRISVFHMPCYLGNGF